MSQDSSLNNGVRSKPLKREEVVAMHSTPFPALDFKNSTAPENLCPAFAHLLCNPRGTRMSRSFGPLLHGLGSASRRRRRHPRCQQILKLKAPQGGLVGCPLEALACFRSELPDAACGGHEAYQGSCCARKKSGHNSRTADGRGQAGKIDPSKATCSEASGTRCQGLWKSLIVLMSVVIVCTPLRLRWAPLSFVS